MAITAKNILKFLLPEYQIIATIEEKGFIARNQFPTQMRLTPTQKYTNGMMQQASPPPGTLRPMQGVPSASVPSMEQSLKQETPFLSQEEGNTNSESNNVFADLPASLKKYWVGSERDRDAICKAFQRPYVRGFDHKIPKNGILLIGETAAAKRMRSNVSASS